jgi:hypothetical protein
MFPLAVLASIVSGAADAAGRRSRLHELANRLGVRAEPEPASDLRQRFLYALRRYPDTHDLLLSMANTMAARHLHADDFPSAGYRDPDIEPLIPWLAERIHQGLLVTDLPWLEALDIHGGGVGEDETDPADVIAEAMAVWPANVWIPGEREALKWQKNLDQGMGYPNWTRNLDSGVGVFETFDNLPVMPRRLVDVWIAQFIFLHPDWESPTADLVDVWRLVFERIGDWVRAVHPDLSRLSFAEAWNQQAAWHGRFDKPLGFGLPVAMYPEDVVLHTWPDGATLVDIRSKRGLTAEGVSMAHCVGGYWSKVRDGESDILSYRDATGIPRATLEMIVGDRAESGWARWADMKQLYGPRDRPLTEEAVRRRLIVFLHDTLGPALLADRGFRRWLRIPSITTVERLAAARHKVAAAVSAIGTWARGPGRKAATPEPTWEEAVDALVKPMMAISVALEGLDPEERSPSWSLHVEDESINWRPVHIRPGIAEPKYWRVVIGPWPAAAGLGFLDAPLGLRLLRGTVDGMRWAWRENGRDVNVPVSTNPLEEWIQAGAVAGSDFIDAMREPATAPGPEHR